MERDPTDDDRVPPGQRLTGATSAVDMDAPSPSTIDTVFDALVDERRRIILSTLIERNGSVSISDLVSHVHRRETGASRDHRRDDTRRRITIDLHHTQLPKLIGAQLIDYDRDADTVSVTPAGRSTQPFLELATEYSNP